MLSLHRPSRGFPPGNSPRPTLSCAACPAVQLDLQCRWRALSSSHGEPPRVHGASRTVEHVARAEVDRPAHNRGTRVHRARHRPCGQELPTDRVVRSQGRRRRRGQAREAAQDHVGGDGGRAQRVTQWLLPHDRTCLDVECMEARGLQGLVARVRGLTRGRVEAIAIPGATVDAPAIIGRTADEPAGEAVTASPVGNVQAGTRVATVLVVMGETSRLNVLWRLRPYLGQSPNDPRGALPRGCAQSSPRPPGRQPPPRQRLGIHMHCSGSNAYPPPFRSRSPRGTVVSLMPAEGIVDLSSCHVRHDVKTPAVRARRR